jgi:DNA-binding NarL/FixJ family response regulator
VSPDAPPITVLVADDHTLFREGLVSLINRWPEFRVVGSAADGDEAIRLVAELHPRLVLMDVRMKPTDGVTATRAITLLEPDVLVAMLTVSDLGDDVYQAVRNGAHGYLSKNDSADRLHDALVSLVAGETVLSPTIAAKVLTELSAPGLPAPVSGTRVARLTLRERQVLRLLVEGLSNEEIGQSLHLSEGAVKKYLGSVMSKLHARNRVQAAVLGLRQGLAE